MKYDRFTGAYELAIDSIGIAPVNSRNKNSGIYTLSCGYRRLETVRKEVV